MKLSDTRVCYGSVGDCHAEQYSIFARPLTIIPQKHIGRIIKNTYRHVFVNEFHSTVRSIYCRSFIRSVHLSAVPQFIRLSPFRTFVRSFVRSQLLPPSSYTNSDLLNANNNMNTPSDCVFLNLEIRLGFVSPPIERHEFARHTRVFRRGGCRAVTRTRKQRHRLPRSRRMFRCQNGRKHASLSSLSLSLSFFLFLSAPSVGLNIVCLLTRIQRCLSSRRSVGVSSASAGLAILRPCSRGFRVIFWLQCSCRLRIGVRSNRYVCRLKCLRGLRSTGRDAACRRG